MKLHSKILGEGSPLIILHGLLGSGDNWQSMARKWAERYEVHLVDQRNHGHSFHSEDFSFEHMTDDLLQYVQDHHLRGVYLIGHSMGGKTAMHFAQQHPEWLEKLVVADIGPKGYEPHHDVIFRALKNVDLGRVGSRGEADQAIGEFVYEPGVRMFLMKNLYWKEKGQLGWRFNLDVLHERYEEIIRPLPSGEIRIPTLFIRGGKSGYVLDEDWPEIQRQFPKAQLSTLPDAGHWLHAEKPAVFFEEVNGFLNG